jgi:hypothetical protein
MGANVTHIYEVHTKTPSSKKWEKISTHTSEKDAHSHARKLQGIANSRDSLKGTQIKVIKIESKPVSERIFSTPAPVKPPKAEKPKAKTNLEKMTSPSAKPHSRRPTDTKAKTKVTARLPKEPKIVLNKEGNK